MSNFLSKLFAAGTKLIDAISEGWAKFAEHLGKKSKPAPTAPILNPALGNSAFGKINYFFVLMLENRSFDHMLGYSGIPGIDGLTGKEFNLYDLHQPEGKKAFATDDAEPVTTPDPPHEFQNVSIHLLGNQGGDYSNETKILNNGFVASYVASVPNKPADAGTVMKAFTPKTLPVLTELARQYAVCNRWFSSLPGPTWPNRFFVHAATSGGLDGSPSGGQTVDSYAFEPFEFANGHIYKSLEDKGIPWRVYHGDAFPQVASMAGLMDELMKGQRFHEFDPCFKSDVQSDTPLPANYIFIEPNYGNAYDSNTDADFEGGNSQHSVGDITAGEKLIKNIYETIRNSKIWPESCLVITYDEHGGFFDHLKPPVVVPPGDQVKYNMNKFDFKRLGVRVPSVVISPWVEKGFVDKETVYDHSSVPATLKKRFNLPDFLTDRDRNANTFDRLFARATPRMTEEEAPTKLPQPFVSSKAKATRVQGLTANIATTKPLDENTKSFLHMVTRADIILNPEQREQILTRVRAIKNQRDAHIYIAEVQKKMRAKKGQKCD